MDSPPVPVPVGSPPCSKRGTPLWCSITMATLSARKILGVAHMTHHCLFLRPTQHARWLETKRKKATLQRYGLIYCGLTLLAAVSWWGDGVSQLGGEEVTPAEVTPASPPLVKKYGRS